MVDVVLTERRLVGGTSTIRRERQLGQSALFELAQSQKLQYAKASGEFIFGRDEKGVVQPTIKLDRLGIVADKWYVNMRFGREDRQAMAGWDLAQFESALKNGRVPRRAKRVSTHLLPAVRLLVHVRESYERELAETERMLRVLDELNVRAAQKGGRERAQIQSLIAQLEELDRSVLAKKYVAVKRIVSRTRLGEAIGKFGQALEAGNHQSAFEIAQACALLTSVRRRLGQWRTAQVAPLYQYNFQKECALRVERDGWLHAQLVRFAQIPQQIFEYVEYDQQRLVVLGQIRAMVQAAEPADDILKYMKDKVELFKVSGRRPAGAEKVIDDIESRARKPDPNLKTDFLYGLYRKLGYAVRDGKKKAARAKIAELECFVNANKPHYILAELQKSQDEYLRPARVALERAVEAFEAQDFEKAGEHFKAAAERLEPHVQ